MGRNKKETTPTQSDGRRADRGLHEERTESGSVEGSGEEELTPQDMITLCMGRFNMTFDEAYVITPRAFFYYQKAYQIRRQEEMFMINYAAWQNKVVNNTKGKGKSERPMFSSFEEFYDYEEEFNKTMFERGVESKHNKKDETGLTMAERNLLMGEALRRVRERKELEKKGVGRYEGVGKK